jgi:hypothetical protein
LRSKKLTRGQARPSDVAVALDELQVGVGDEFLIARLEESIDAAAAGEPGPEFDGETYESEEDRVRLGRQLDAVRDLMIDGEWRILASIRAKAGGTEASVSARLRDLRKEKFGAFRVERRRCSGEGVSGLFEYRVLPPLPEEHEQPPLLPDDLAPGYPPPPPPPPPPAEATV